MPLPADLAPLEHDPDRVRDAVADVLSDPAYREPEPSILERALDAIGDFIGDVLGRLSGGGPGSVIGTVVVLALVLVAVVVIARSLGSITIARSVEDATVASSRHRRSTAADWRAEAVALARAGEHRDAIRCRHRAVVATAVEARLLDDVPGRTAREVEAALVSAKLRAAPALARLTDIFEAVWYGGAVADAALFDDSDVLAGDVEAALTATPAPEFAHAASAA